MGVGPENDAPPALEPDNSPGSVQNPDEPVTVTPTRAVLHRLAGAPDDLPSCVRIEPTA